MNDATTTESAQSAATQRVIAEAKRCLLYGFKIEVDPELGWVCTCFAAPHCPWDYTAGNVGEATAAAWRHLTVRHELHLAA